MAVMKVVLAVTVMVATPAMPVERTWSIRRMPVKKNWLVTLSCDHEQFHGRYQQLLLHYAILTYRFRQRPRYDDP